MRDAAPGPALITSADLASIAWMSRKSSLSASATWITCQCAPSVVRSTVPLAPLAHATVSLTTDRPRSSDVMPLVSARQACWAHAVVRREGHRQGE